MNPGDYQRIYAVCSRVAAGNRDLKATLKGTAGQVACSATGTLVGGLAFGPIGALCGGIAGAAAGYLASPEYKPVTQVLEEMNEKERKKFAKSVADICIKEAGLHVLELLLASAVGQDVVEYLTQQVLIALGWSFSGKQRSKPKHWDM